MVPVMVRWAGNPAKRDRAANMRCNATRTAIAVVFLATAAHAGNDDEISSEARERLFDLALPKIVDSGSIPRPGPRPPEKREDNTAARRGVTSCRASSQRARR